MQTSNLNFQSLIWVLTSQTVAAVTLLLDIPIARQVSVFLFLILVPGFVIMKMLGHERPYLAESVLFSVGLSLSFLMLIGFLINAIGSYGLISKPLSTGSLFIIINMIVSLMCILGYIRNRSDSRNLIYSLKLQHIIFLVLPLLTIIGVLLTIALDNNLLLISVYVIIAVIFAATLFAPKSSIDYSVLVFSIGLALLLSTALISRYVYGPDIALEYSAFRETQNASSLDWTPSSFEQIATKSMMSVTILPTIFSNLMNADGDFIFKIVFIIIFSLVPLGLYQLYQKHWGKKIAFASVIFFVATFGFYSVMIAQGKQMIAELFYVLLFLLIFTEGFSHDRSTWLIIMFLVLGLVISHYSISYMFIFMIILTVLSLKITRKKRSFKINSTLAAFSLCLTFLWYTTMAYGPFEKFVNTIQQTISSFLTEFFYLGSRGESVQLAVGAITPPTILHGLATIINDAAILLILIGFVSSFLLWKKDKLNSEYFIVTSLNMGLLFSALIVPRFAGFLEMWRLYHIALLFVAPLFAVGAITLASKLSNLKRRKKNLNIDNEKAKMTYGLILISIVLVPYFLFQTGLVYEIAADPSPSSIALSRNKMENNSAFIIESDVFSALWLSDYGMIENMFTYSDTVALLFVLNSYSEIDRRMNLLLSNTTQRINYYDTWKYDDFSQFANTSYIYLRQFNVINEKTVWNIGENIQYNVTEIPILNNTNAFINRVYTNGASEIYYRVPFEGN